MADVVIVEAAAPWRVAPPQGANLPSDPALPAIHNSGRFAGCSSRAQPARGIPLHCRGLKIRLGVGGWSLWKSPRPLEISEVEIQGGPVGHPLARGLDRRCAWCCFSRRRTRQRRRSLADGFQAPAFPLAAGTSDALLKSVAVRVEAAEPISTRSLAHVLVFREILPNYELHGSLDEIPLHRTIRAPTVERLPTGFIFEPDGRTAPSEARNRLVYW